MDCCLAARAKAAAGLNRTRTGLWSKSKKWPLLGSLGERPRETVEHKMERPRVISRPTNLFQSWRSRTNLKVIRLLKVIGEIGVMLSSHRVQNYK